jgi:hypothetical protein
LDAVAVALSALLCGTTAGAALVPQLRVEVLGVVVVVLDVEEEEDDEVREELELVEPEPRAKPGSEDTAKAAKASSDTRRLQDFIIPWFLVYGRKAKGAYHTLVVCASIRECGPYGLPLSSHRGFQLFHKSMFNKCAMEVFYKTKSSL